MSARNNTGWLLRTLEMRARIGRKLRRTYHRLRTRPSALDRMSDEFIYSLYRRAAANLGLDAYVVGRVPCLAGHGKMFHIWECTTEFDTFALYTIVEDKILIRQLFQDKGFAIPEGRAFAWQDVSAGVAYALSLGRPCVMKPAIESGGGKGVTTRLTKRADIARAFRFAGLFSAQVLIEEFLPGDCYRFLVYKGRCLSVLQRHLPTVVGDGVSTVRQLVDAENRKRHIPQEWREGDPFFNYPVPTDAAALRHLRRQGRHWDSILVRGESLHLAGPSNLSFGCTYSEVLHKTHPALIRIAEQAANSLGMTIAGLDIIAPNIEAPAYHILEINIGPGIDIHYALTNPDKATDPIHTILTDYFEIGRPDPAK